MSYYLRVTVTSTCKSKLRLKIFGVFRGGFIRILIKCKAFKGLSGNNDLELDLFCFNLESCSYLYLYSSRYFDANVSGKCI